MSINDKVEFFGNTYVAVEYTGRPIGMIPTKEDEQCSLCQLSENFCKMKDECHQEPRFIFAKEKHVRLMDSLNYL